MTSGAAATIDEYIAALPADRRDIISRVREVVRSHLPRGYRETIRWGMISWEVPLERFPETYNGQPLAVAALAAQKNYNALYLTCAYQDPAAEQALRESAAKAGIRLDMGTSCLRFRRLDQVPLDGVATMLMNLPVDAFIAQNRAARTGASVAGSTKPHTDAAKRAAKQRPAAVKTKR